MPVVSRNRRLSVDACRAVEKFLHGGDLDASLRGGFQHAVGAPVRCEYAYVRECEVVVRSCGTVDRFGHVRSAPGLEQQVSGLQFGKAGTA